MSQRKFLILCVVALAAIVAVAVASFLILNASDDCRRRVHRRHCIVHTLPDGTRTLECRLLPRRHRV
jgi:hypothetical protein